MAPNVASLSWSISGKEGLLMVSLALPECDISGISSTRRQDPIFGGLDVHLSEAR
jgi:hypothetical protein